MPAPEVKIDAETLKNQIEPLSEEQNILIADAAHEELALENESTEAKQKREEKEAEETKAADEANEDLVKRAKDAGLEEGASEDEVVSAELKTRAKDVGLEEDASLEDVEAKELTTRAKAVGLGDDATLEEVEAKEEENKPTEDDEQAKKDKEAAELAATEEDAAIVKALMEPDKDGKKLTETEAKEILEKDKAVIKKFDGEPHKLARSYRDLQGRADKAEEKAKHIQGLQEEAQANAAVNAKIDIPTVKNLIVNGQISDGKGGKLTEAQVIDATKKQYPSQTKDKEDDEILEFTAEKIRDTYLKGQDRIKGERTGLASAKRDKLFADLPEHAKEFEAEIKAEVNKFSDAQILSPNFDLTDVIRWAKGEKYDSLKADTDKVRKEGYDAGLKKGKEEAEALGERTPGPKNKVKTNKPATGLSRTMNHKEEQRALDMYEGIPGMSDKEKFKSYIEQFPKENDEFK